MTIRNRELSQFGSFIYIKDSTKSIGITTQQTPYVGIGTLDAEYKLHVVGDVGIDGDIFVTGNLNIQNLEYISVGIITATQFFNALGQELEGFDSWNQSNFPDIYKEVGNVGIGTNNPTSKLQVIGNANISGSITASSFVGNGSGLTGVGIGSTGSIDTSGIVTASAFFGNGSGLTGVGIGSTGSINTSGIVTASAFFGNGSGLTGIFTGTSISNDTTTNSTFYPLLTQSTSGIVTTSRVSSTKLNFNPSTGTLTVIDLNSTSDLNLKENIHTVENALDTVNSLRGVSFDWKENGKSSYGVIAQELEEVLPSLVSNGDVKSVNYHGLIGVLIEAIKELKAEIEELKNS